MKKIGNKGGMALTTGFDVFFEFDSDTTFSQQFYNNGDENVVNMLCDEAQLPNVQSATGGMNRYLGEGTVQYPHTRMFTDVSLGFLCDAQMTPFKFFSNWYGFIYGDEMPSVNGAGLEGARGTSPLQSNRVNRLKYMDEYTATCKIMKTEPNDVSSSGRVSTVIMLENCYPYSLDAVPLQYGSSQVARINVNFYYSRHTVAHGTPGNDQNFNIASFFG